MTLKSNPSFRAGGPPAGDPAAHADRAGAYARNLSLLTLEPTLVYAQEVPGMEIPLHTLIELVPTPDGRMAEERIPFAVRRSMEFPPRTAMEKQFSEMITLSVNREGA